MSQTIARRLGMRKSQKPLPTDRIGHFVGNTSLLLVLDTFEHLIHSILDSKSQLERLLYLYPQLTMMVTSREALHLGMERNYSSPVVRA